MVATGAKERLQPMFGWNATAPRLFFQQAARLGDEYAQGRPDPLHERMDQGDPDDVALLIYISGTTGPPKGAMLTHKNVLWTADSLGKANPIYGGEETLSFLPLSHIVQRMVALYLPLYWAFTVNFCENTDTVLQDMREITPTLVFGVPIREVYGQTEGSGPTTIHHHDRIKLGTAMIVIDEENVSNWAQLQKIPSTTYTDLSQNEQVYELIQQEVNEVNNTLANAQQVKKFAILPTRLHQEAGDVTPTLKVERQALMERFADIVERLYRGPDPAMEQEDVQEEDALQQQAAT